ncbi:MAG: hypothetical protein ACFHWZ_12535 [Phycisphaerales bacterium]
MNPAENSTSPNNAIRAEPIPSASSGMAGAPISAENRRTENFADAQPDMPIQANIEGRAAGDRTEERAREDDGEGDHNARADLVELRETLESRQTRLKHLRPAGRPERAENTKRRPVGIEHGDQGPIEHPGPTEDEQRRDVAEQQVSGPKTLENAPGEQRQVQFV